jgi:hypothetical protein
MNVKKPLFALLAASALGATAIPAQSQVIVEYSAPAYRYTVPPDEPPVHQIYREGHWSWNGYRYVWVAPAPRPSYYAFRTERDRADRDRDGVPNWADRDIDGDGVPNRLDRFPYDPYRS